MRSFCLTGETVPHGTFGVWGEAWGGVHANLFLMSEGAVLIIICFGGGGYQQGGGGMNIPDRSTNCNDLQ